MEIIYIYIYVYICIYIYTCIYIVVVISSKVPQNLFLTKHQIVVNSCAFCGIKNLLGFGATCGSTRASTPSRWVDAITLMWNGEAKGETLVVENWRFWSCAASGNSWQISVEEKWNKNHWISDAMPCALRTQAAIWFSIFTGQASS